MAPGPVVPQNFCPAVVHGEGCADSSCLLDHDVAMCEVCVMVCSPAANYFSHTRGRVHQTNLRLASTQPGRRGYNVDMKQCTLCSMSVPYDTWGIHLSNPIHKKHQELAYLRSAYEMAELDKQGVSVSHAEDGVTFGVISLEQATEGVQTELTVSASATKKFTSILQTQIQARISNHAKLSVFTCIHLQCTAHKVYTQVHDHSSPVEQRAQGGPTSALHCRLPAHPARPIQRPSGVHFPGGRPKIHHRATSDSGRRRL